MDDGNEGVSEEAVNKQTKDLSESSITKVHFFFSFFSLFCICSKIQFQDDPSLPPLLRAKNRPRSGPIPPPKNLMATVRDEDDYFIQFLREDLNLEAIPKRADLAYEALQRYRALQGTFKLLADKGWVRGRGGYAVPLGMLLLFCP